MSYHFWLHVNLYEILAIMDINSETNHVGKNNHIAGMCAQFTLELSVASELELLSKLSVFIIHIRAYALVKRSALS
jgi:hypothetical protein